MILNFKWFTKLNIHTHTHNGEKKKTNLYVNASDLYNNLVAIYFDE